MKGVRKVVPVGESAVAVVADTWWQAKTALDALPIEWDQGDNAKTSSASIADWLKAGLDAEQAFVGNQNGDAKAALASATKTVEAVYSYPYQNHATMEPMNTTVLYTADKCEVWCPTQNGDTALAAVIEASGLPAGKCDVHKVPLGGGFGRRTFTDYIRQAVAIAKETPGTPVKLLWSREEDMTHGHYHPVTQAKMIGGFDANGTLIALHMRISGQSILASVLPERLQNGRDPATFQGLNPGGAESAIGYTVPNLLIDHSMRNPSVPPGFWRGVNINQNAIYLECFIDELAQSIGQDPLEFRRKLMTQHPKHLAVLNAVAEKIGWEKSPPQGIHRGIAQMMSFGSYVAAAAEISVDNGNKIKIHRLVAATDCGTAVNPAQIERQISAHSSTAYRHCFIRSAQSTEGVSNRRTSTVTTRCGSLRCPRSKPSSCRVAASGVGSANRPSALPHQRYSTPSSMRRVNGSARSRSRTIIFNSRDPGAAQLNAAPPLVNTGHELASRFRSRGCSARDVSALSRERSGRTRRGTA